MFKLALETIVHLMQHAQQASVRLAAAGQILERAFGKSTERREIVLGELAKIDDDALNALITLKVSQAGLAPATLLIAESEQ